MADNLPPSSADVTESRGLNIPEPSQPHRPAMGLLYLYLFLKKIVYVKLMHYCRIFIEKYCRVKQATDNNMAHVLFT
jgi:hypothetical protein